MFLLRREERRSTRADAPLDAIRKGHGGRLVTNYYTLREL